jgi:hypothetical protein
MACWPFDFQDFFDDFLECFAELWCLVVLPDLVEVLAAAAEDRVRANEIMSAVARKNRKRHLKMNYYSVQLDPERNGLGCVQSCWNEALRRSLIVVRYRAA